jgi:4-hydroxybenzoate polyprenyltransferase
MLLVYFSASLFEVKVQPIILLQIFAITMTVYSLNKITDKAEDKINKPHQNTKLRLYFITMAIICCIITIATGIVEGLIDVLVLLVPIVIGLAYSIKLYKLPKLKEQLFIKSFAVTFSWAFICTILPILRYAVTPEKVVMVFGYIFIQIFVNALIFDIVDMPGDKAANTKTIPLYLGKKRTTQLLIIINSLLLIWIGACFAYGLFINYLPAVVFGMLYSYALIWYFTKNPDKRFHAEVIVDGEWIPIVAVLQLISRLKII